MENLGKSLAVRGKCRGPGVARMAGVEREWERGLRGSRGQILQDGWPLCSLWNIPTDFKQKSDLT